MCVRHLGCGILIARLLSRVRTRPFRPLRPATQLHSPRPIRHSILTSLSRLHFFSLVAMSRPATRHLQQRDAAAASGLRDSDSGSAATPPSAAAGPTEPHTLGNAHTESHKRRHNESPAALTDCAVAGLAAANRPKALAPQPAPDSDAQSSFRSAAGSSACSCSVSPPVLAPLSPNRHRFARGSDRGTGGGRAAKSVRKEQCRS